MADAYWNRQQSVHHSSPMPMAKRPRADYDLPYGAAPGQDSFQHLPRDNNRAGLPTVKDTKSIEESYERYLQNVQHPSFGSGELSNFSGTGAGKHGGGMPTGGVHSLAYEDVHSLPYGHSAIIGRPGPRTIIPDMIPNELGLGYGGEFPMDPLGRKGPPPAWEKPLPPNASNTIFVDGLPRGITQREVAHIFRPFVGYKEARIVTKEPKYQDADPVVLCFVDFIDAVHAMRAIDALQVAASCSVTSDLCGAQLRKLCLGSVGLCRPMFWWLWIIMSSFLRNPSLIHVKFSLKSIPYRLLSKGG